VFETVVNAALLRTAELTVISVELFNLTAIVEFSVPTPAAVCWKEA